MVRDFLLYSGIIFCIFVPIDKLFPPKALMKAIAKRNAIRWILEIATLTKDWICVDSEKSIFVSEEIKNEWEKMNLNSLTFSLVR
ncbi:hypothetical protein HMPREF9071_1125 [Capnocytophaga sp. oral taxon 338 str. F0234]|nr:hypothetical protein HMPREF9071_1125 [Capnocytophaga sp. oral taxon 338 str. F0234]